MKSIKHLIQRYAVQYRKVRYDIEVSSEWRKWNRIFNTTDAARAVFISNCLGKDDKSPFA